MDGSFLISYQNAIIFIGFCFFLKSKLINFLKVFIQIDQLLKFFIKVDQFLNFFIQVDHFLIFFFSN